jgi:ribulose-5-phosphate 4-epimerase/fuculose-1-phosphate aldolase
MNPPASAPAVKVVKSVREQVGEEEWAARVNLAAHYRLVAMHGYTEGTANHISTSVPGKPNEFLINPYGLLYDEVTASSLIRIDNDGEVLFNATEYSVNKAGFVIHSAIHMARPDAVCVAHTHTPAGMAVSAMKCGLLPIAQSGMKFQEQDVAYHDFEGIAENIEERERLVADIGNKNVLILRNHGLLVCGESVAQCWSRLFSLERACETQIMTMTSMAKIIVPPKDVMEKVHTQFNRPRPPAERDRAWPAMLRKLDRVDPSYKH